MLKEKRKFKRYPNDCDCTVSAMGNSHRAKNLDYCFEGVRAVVDNNTTLKPGDSVDIDIPHPLIKNSGRVVWVKRINGGVKIGAQRIGLLFGDFKDFHLPDILLGLQRSGRTGVLYVMQGGSKMSLYFEKGDMIFATSDRPNARLGDMLVKKGVITQEQYQKATELMMKSGKRLGAVLVELGHLTQDGLVHEVKNHVEGIIISLFELTEGGFMFKDGPLPSEEVVKLNLSAANIIYRGMKRVHDREYLKSICPKEDTLMGLSSDPLNLFQDLRLDEQDKKILSLCNRRIVRDIFSSSDADEFETLRTLCAFTSTRIIEPKEPEGKVHEGPSVEDVVGEHAAGNAAAFIETLEKMYQNYEDIGYYGILGIEKTASASDIKKAYYCKAREFHPDKHFSLPGEGKDKLNTVFTYINSAYATLVNPDLRMKYDSQPTTVRQETDPKEMAREKFKQGKNSLANSRFEEAYTLFSEAAYLQSDVADYHMHVGIALSKTGKHKEAVRAIERALKRDPSNANCHAEIGHVYLALGFDLRAKSSFEKALKAEPGHKRAAEGVSRMN